MRTCQRITKVSRIHPLATMNVRAKFCVNQSNRGISACAEVVDQLIDQHTESTWHLYSSFHVSASAQVPWYCSSEMCTCWCIHSPKAAKLCSFCYIITRASGRQDNLMTNQRKVVVWLPDSVNMRWISAELDLNILTLKIVFLKDV